MDVSLSFVPEKEPHDPCAVDLGHAALSEREGCDQGGGFVLWDAGRSLCVGLV